MVAALHKSPSLAEWLADPPAHTEWIDGKLANKDDMTAKHGRTQSRLSRYWGNFVLEHSVGGEVYTETPCRTTNQGRRPDVAYLTPALLTQYGADFATLPQAFPLIAEIISPSDPWETAMAKATEYFAAGCLEVWFLLPESQHIFVQTQDGISSFSSGDIACTQKVLSGFTIAVDELLGDSQPEGNGKAK
ncbi:MAG: Uma2 family endonuclease [Cyanobacteria bacterium P01_A01_bin.105]